MFAETTGLNRQRIGELLQHYERILACGDREHAVQIQKILEDFLDKFEEME